MVTKGTPGRPRLTTGTPQQQARREQQRRWKAAHQERQREKYKVLIEDFLSNPCVDCGVQYPLPAMHPDHVRGEKYAKIAWFKFGNGSEQRLREELAKCDVRCANCHSIRHAIEDGRWHAQ